MDGSASLDAEPTDDPRTPDVAGTVAGWRTWNVAGTDPRLISPVVGETWPPRTPTRAVCRTGHAAPSPTCGCGLYAVHDVRTAIAAGGDVLGCVSLWGDVVEGDHGWRAELGHPRLLIAGPEVDAATRSRLAERYGVPVHAAATAPRDLVAVLGEPEAAELVARADTVRTAPAGTSGADGADLAALFAPGAMPQGSANLVLPLVAFCLFADLWAGAAAAVDALVRGDHVTGVLATLLSLALICGVCAALRSALVAALELRVVLGQALGVTGERLWRVAWLPGLAAYVLQPVAVWELLAHRDPSWVAGLLVAPVLIAVLAGVPWLATHRSVRRRTGHRPVAWALGGVLVTAALTATALHAVAFTELGDDLAFLNTPRRFWEPRLDANGPPGLCLSDRAGFRAGQADTVVECRQPHWGEIAGYVRLGPPPYPGDDQAGALAELGCRRLAAAQGATAALDVDVLAPGAATWNDAGRTADSYAACAVFRRDGLPLPPGSHVEGTPPSGGPPG